MTAADVDSIVAEAVANALLCGAQPARVLLGVRGYRLLATRDKLAPRSIGKSAATSLRAYVDGFDLPIDCDAGLPDGEAVCTFVRVEMGRA